MVSMTWKKVTGSVSIPSVERGSISRNSRASCSLSSRSGGSRRIVSIAFDAAATAGRTASARAITVRSPARSAEVAISVSKTMYPNLCLPNARRRQVQPVRQFLVDLFDRLAPGFEADEIIYDTGHQEPAAEIDEGRRNLGQRHVGLEIIVGAHDQGKPHRSDDLANAAETIGRAHAGGSQMRRPDLGRIGSD